MEAILCASVVDCDCESIIIAPEKHRKYISFSRKIKLKVADKIIITTKRPFLALTFG